MRYFNSANGYTVIIRYTTTEGKQRDFKFPLAGFKEKYLEQFV